jgi:Tol biopolymer transport system component
MKGFKMKWFDSSKKRLVLAGFVTVAILTGTRITKADYIFGEPTNLGPIVNSSARDEEPGISSDGLSIYYCSLRTGGRGGYDMWVTTRATTQDDWGTPVNLGSPVNSSSDDFSEDISADGLELYFGSNRPGSSGYDIWVAKRATTESAWAAPVNLGSAVNSSATEGCPSISDDGLELYFWSDRSGGFGSYDIWVSRRENKEDAWGMAVNLGPMVNSSTSDLCTDVSPDGLSLIFVSARSGGYGGEFGDLWMVRRPSTSEPWGQPVNLGPAVNGSSSENGPCLSADGSVLYFSSDRAGGSGTQDMWQVSISPVVDFNGDGIVDSVDMCIVIDHWGENYPLCDIGPTPFGDGIVDVQDLIVVAEHLFEEVLPVGLISYWKLDEAEGGIAEDTVGDNDGIVYGDAFWQPEGGVKGGALQLDGIEDYISADFVLDPADGPFSVFAWINSSVPGGVVISQLDGIGGSGETWLGTEPASGKLMTGLVAPPVGRFVPKPLVSESVITDGQWHNVGFVCDGTQRSLYVDGIEAAEDANAQAALKPATGGLYIGAGKNLEAGTFFSGMIDDVRIYNVALSAEQIAALAQ